METFRSRYNILCVRWYLKYPISYRMLEEMMIERGLQMAPSTIMRWVHQYSPVIEEKIRKHLKKTNDSWRMDETYIKIKGKDCYLYRAKGQVEEIQCILSEIEFINRIMGVSA